MEKNDGRLAAGSAIDHQQRAQFGYERIGRRQCIAGGSGGAGGGALSAARAAPLVDRNVIAGWRNRTGGTKIKAAAATDDPRARMRAKIGLERDITRLVELANEVARLQHRS